ncbi:MAG: dicarboxylate/amino acid:cation symporter [Candidatus Caenarcaniphilales bacterium]|nr:dicarboxylate/amino acid:cation symporter [Candidatus Caenarcaniphilales bacterium]
MQISTASESENNNIKPPEKKGFKLDLHWQILIAMAVGIFVGLGFSSCGDETSFFNSFFKGAGACALIKGTGITVDTFSWMGEVFLRLLKMIVIPLIFCSLINGISHMKANQLGKVGLITFLTFKISMLIAAVIGLFFVNLIKPGVGFDVSSISKVDVGHLTQHTHENFFLQIIPSNIFSALSSDHQLIQVIFFALVFGIALIKGGKETASLSKAFEEVFKVMLKITHWIMYLAPFGVFGLIIKTVGSTGLAPFVSVGKYMITVVLALSTMLFVVTPLLAWLVGKMNPLKFFAGVQDAMLTALGTSSSAATLPVSLECVQENLKVPQSIASFVVTIGSTMSMNGAALYEAVVTLFLAQAYAPLIPGIDLSIKGQIFIVAMVLLSTLGTPGIPHGGLITTTMVLQAVGLPIDAIGLIVGVDRILDMCRTMTNVTGDCLSAVIVNRFVNSKEIEKDETEDLTLNNQLSNPKLNVTSSS